MAAPENKITDQQPSEGASSAMATKAEPNAIEMLAEACEGRAQLPSEDSYSNETEARFTQSATRIKALKLTKSALALKRQRNIAKKGTKKMGSRMSKATKITLNKTTSATTFENPKTVSRSLSISSNLLASVPPVVNCVARAPSTIASIPPTLTHIPSSVPRIPLMPADLVPSPVVGIHYQPSPHQPPPLQVRYQTPHVSTASIRPIYQPYQYQLAVPNTVHKPAYIIDLEKRVHILELTVKLLQEKLSYNETARENAFSVTATIASTPPLLPPSHALSPQPNHISPLEPSHVLSTQQPHISTPQSSQVPPPSPTNRFNLSQVVNTGPTEENHYSFLRYIFAHYIWKGLNEYGSTIYKVSQEMEQSVQPLGSDGPVIARILMRKLFTPYELSVSNVRGVGKQALDPIRISAIREVCMKAAQVPLHQQEIFWRTCIKVMDTANRNSKKYIKSIPR